MTSYGPSAPYATAEGETGSPTSRTDVPATAVINGMSQLTAPVSGLIGVFLDNNVPTASPAPSSPGPAWNTTWTQQPFYPGLNQPFYIGNGLIGGTGPAQQYFIAPANATRLFLGTMDGYGWYNNLGSLTVTSSVIGCLSLVCPANLVVTSCVPTPVSYAPTVTENCCTNGPVMVMCTPPSGSTFAPNTTTTVNCVATDSCSNSCTCSFTVTVVCTNCVQLVNSGTTVNLYGITYGNSEFVAVGAGGAILASPDGIDWTSRTSGTANTLYGIAYGNNEFATVGGGATILTSPDAITWTGHGVSGPIPLGTFTSIAYGDNIFVAMTGAPTGGTSLGAPVSSSDGVTWNSYVATYGAFTGITYGNNDFVAVANLFYNNFNILTFNVTSAPGWPELIQISLEAAIGTNVLNGVAYGNNMFVAVGASGTIWTSSDGVNWSASTSGTTSDLNAITYGNCGFMVVGAQGIILFSPDGANWSAGYSGTPNDLQSVAYGDNEYVAVGNNGAILSVTNCYSCYNYTNGCISLACPSNMVVTSCTSTQLFYAPTVTDACCTNWAVMCSPPSGTSFEPGTTNTVTCLATDSCGNSNTCSFTVTVLPSVAYASWALQYFACTNCAIADPDADPLGKGMSNTNQFLAGFDPTNSTAYLHIISIALTNTTDINVIYLGANGDNTWTPGIASRTNILEYSTGAANGSYTNYFLPVPSAGATNILSGGNGLGVVTNMVESGGATNVPSRYYRVRVLVP